VQQNNHNAGRMICLREVVLCTDLVLSSRFVLPVLRKNDPTRESIVLFLVLFRTPKHTKVSRKMIAKHNSEKSNSFRCAIDDAIAGSASGKVEDHIHDRLTREKKRLEKKISKVEKKVDDIAKNIIIPKSVVVQDTSKFDRLDIQLEQGNTMVSMDTLKAHLTTSTELKVVTEASKKERKKVVTVKELGRQGVVNASLVAKKAESEKQLEGLERKLEKARDKGEKFARSVKTVLQEDDAFKRAANLQLITEEELKEKELERNFVSKIAVLEKERKKSALDHKHAMTAARVVSNRVNREAARARKHANRLLRKQEQEEKKLNLGIYEESPLIRVKAKYYGYEQVLPVTQGDCDDLRNPYADDSDDDEKDEEKKELPKGTLLFSIEPEVSKENEVKELGEDSEEEDNSFGPDPSLFFDEKSIPYIPRSSLLVEKKEPLVWKDFCFRCCIYHTGSCDKTKYRRAFLVPGSLRDKVEKGGEKIASFACSLVDDSKDSETTRNVKYFFSVVVDILDTLYMVLYSDEVCTRIAMRHFVEKYIDTKDMKYSRLVNVLMVVIQEIRQWFWSEQIELQFIKERLEAFCRKYKYKASVELEGEGKSTEKLPETQGVMDDILGVFKGVTK